MSKAIYYQNGKNIDFINNTESMINAGDIVNLSCKIAVAGGTIPVGETGAVITTGVFRLPKSTASAINNGVPVFFDTDTGEVCEDKSKVPAGITVAAAGASDSTVLVDISAGAAALALSLTLASATAATSDGGTGNT